MTEMTNSPLSGVGGGGGAYMDSTVDKMSFMMGGFEFGMVNSVNRFVL